MSHDVPNDFGMACQLINDAEGEGYQIGPSLCQLFMICHLQVQGQIFIAFWTSGIQYQAPKDTNSTPRPKLCIWPVLNPPSPIKNHNAQISDKHDMGNQRADRKESHRRTDSRNERFKDGKFKHVPTRSVARWLNNQGIQRIEKSHIEGVEGHGTYHLEPPSWKTSL